MSDQTQVESMGGTAGRQKASDAMRDAAKFLRRRADNMEVIASALDRCVSTGTGGQEGHPHIGVGSDAEIALWEWAISVR